MGSLPDVGEQDEWFVKNTPTTHTTMVIFKEGFQRLGIRFGSVREDLDACVLSLDRGYKTDQEKEKWRDWSRLFCSKYLPRQKNAEKWLLYAVIWLKRHRLDDEKRSKNRKTKNDKDTSCAQPILKDNILASSNLALLPPAESTDTVSNYLASMDGFDKDLVNMLKSLQLSLLDKQEKDTDYLILPRVLKAENCWSGSPLTYKELFVGTLESLSCSTSSFTVFKNGEKGEKKYFAQAVYQLHEPDPTDPVFLTGIKVLGIHDNSFRIPSQLSVYVESFFETNLQLNMCPKYSVVEPHIDYSTDGLSITVKDCVKLMLLWAPTTANLAVIKEAEGQKEKLMRIRPRLECGKIVQLTSLNAIYIPAGWIHATMTTKGGFLVAKDFTTLQSAIPMAMYLKSGLDGYLSKQMRCVAWDWFYSCLQITLDKGSDLFPRAIEAWIIAMDSILRWVEFHPKWAEKVRKLWMTFFDKSSRNHNYQGECPCYVPRGKESFPMHFKRCHLQSILPTQEATREPNDEESRSSKRPRRK